jgi:hypothetical protein
MAQIRGNLISLTGSLMTLYPDAQKKADDVLFKECKKHWKELAKEDFVDSRMWDVFMNTYAQASPQGERALITVGRRVYPAIKSAGQIPKEIDSPLKMLKFEGEGFKLYHKGPDVIPRKFLKEEEGEVIVDAPSPGYNCIVIEGVFIGILEMFRKQGTVVQEKCVKKGNSTYLYHIKW